MIEINLFLSLIFFFMSCLMFSFFYKHLMLTLISLEFMMINILNSFYLILMLLKINTYIINFFITISVCESVIGLSLLIYMVQMSGSDYMKLMNMLKW